MFNWFKRSSKSGAADRPARSNELRPQATPRPSAAAGTPAQVGPGPGPSSGRGKAGAPAAVAPAPGGPPPAAKPRPIAAVDVRAAGLTVASTPVGANLPASQPQLSPHAQRILARLPPEARLDVACARFPHAVESLLRHWSRPEAFRQALDALMIDARGNRQGFPFEVMMEFTSLRDYYEARVVPNETRLWDKTDVR